MAKHLIQNPLTSLHEAQVAYGVLPKPHEWRLMQECPIGEVNGVPTMRGTAVATNGIHVLILRGSELIVGHMASFVTDEVDSPEHFAKSTTNREKKSQYPMVNPFAGFI